MGKSKKYSQFDEIEDVQEFNSKKSQKKKKDKKKNNFDEEFDYMIEIAEKQNAYNKKRMGKRRRDNS